jgi:pimeloyl-ACP methyl ester carboxylesterase
VGSTAAPSRSPTRTPLPELRADDLARLLTHHDAGPATVFGSSGGAVTALALAQHRPDQVRMVIAHEPPLVELLEDREQRHAATEDIIATYASSGRAAAWRKFLVDANIVMPEEAFEYAFGGELGPREAADENHFFPLRAPSDDPLAAGPRRSAQR